MLYVTRVQSSKDKSKTFIVLCYELSYRVVMLNFDRNICAELLNLPVSKLEDIQVGDKCYVE